MNEESTPIVQRTPIPRILGRFNYYQTIKGYYTIIYADYIGAASIIIARNLSYEQTIRLCDDWNIDLKDLREEIKDDETDQS